METAWEKKQAKVASKDVTTSDALKEIANRLKKLSFRDMKHLESVINQQSDDQDFSEILLAAADYLEAN